MFRTMSLCRSAVLGFLPLLSQRCRLSSLLNLTLFSTICRLQEADGFTGTLDPSDETGTPQSHASLAPSSGRKTEQQGYDSLNDLNRQKVNSLQLYPNSSSSSSSSS